MKKIIEKKIEESFNSTKKEMANMADDIKGIRGRSFMTSSFFFAILDPPLPTISKCQITPPP